MIPRGPTTLNASSLQNQFVLPGVVEDVALNREIRRASQQEQIA